MRSVEEHQRVVTELITARPAVAVELRDAEGLVLAEDVTATLSLPVFDNSAMDGYAVRADEVASATAEHPVKLPVAEDIPAGRTDIPVLDPGTAHRIMTGAPIPAGATAIVPVEATDGGTDVVTITTPSAEGRHIRRTGEDVAAGTTVLRAGQVVTPAVVGLAAALGLHAADSDPTSARPGDLHRIRTRLARCCIAAGADLRVELAHAGRRDPRGRRRRGRRGDRQR